MKFKQFLNEVKVSANHAEKYLKLIKSYLGARKFSTEFVDGVLEAKYDNVSLLFKDSYLVGFKDEDGEYYEVSRSLKSVKELQTISDIQKAFGKKVESPNRLTIKVKDIHTYFPKSNKELKDIVDLLIKTRGNNCDLNDIDVSNVTDMSYIFNDSQFNGDISKWDVSNVTDMTRMFFDSAFNGDISKWNVSNVKDMTRVFFDSAFNGDISKWNVSNVTNMFNMFGSAEFKGDISKWNVSNVTDMGYMFAGAEFNGDISKWNVSNVTDMSYMFKDSPFNGDISKWDVSNVEYGQKHILKFIKK